MICVPRVACCRVVRLGRHRGRRALPQRQQHAGAQHDQRGLDDQRHRPDPVTPVADVTGVTRHAHRARGDVRQERPGAQQHGGRPAEPGRPSRAGRGTSSARAVSTPPTSISR